MVDRDEEQARSLVDSTRRITFGGRNLAISIAMGVMVAVVLSLFGLTGSDDPRDTTVIVVAVIAATIIVASMGLVKVNLRRAKASRSALDALSYVDRLTGLPNRRFLGDPFEEIITRARRSNARVAVLFMTVEGLESVNENYGHEVGDTLVVAIVERLLKELAPEDTLCRYGGAEFVAVISSVTTAATTERIARRLLEALQKPFDLADETIMVSGVIGITVTEDRPARPSEILSDAEAAMRRAKRTGSGHYAIFDRSHNDLMTPARAERTLREAVDNGEFRLYYQPIVSLWTKRLVGVEALLRWKTASKGTVSPAEFLPALEDSGLIVPVGMWTINEVCRQVREWIDQNPDHSALNIKINISPRQLSQANFVAQIRHAITASGIEPERLFLDLEESPITGNFDALGSTFTQLRDLGVKLSMNDFGSERTSLKELRRFGLEMLSIDRTFIEGIGESSEDTTIVEHVIGIAKALGIVTVAEGVETAEQVELLRSMNCDLAQGWYFSHPQPPDVITQLMSVAKQRHEWQPPVAPDEESDAPVVRLDRFDQRD